MKAEVLCRVSYVLGLGNGFDLYEIGWSVITHLAALFERF